MLTTSPNAIRQLRQTWRLALIVLLCLNPSYAANESTAAPPPRTIDDLTRLLEHYKPDPKVAAQALAAANQPVPAGADANALFVFYTARAEAAARIGRVSQQLNDLRAAVAGGKGRQENADYVDTLRDLSRAEVMGGNLLRGIARAEEAIRMTDPQSLGKALGAHQNLTQLYSIVGDFDNAKLSLQAAESFFVTLQSNSRVRMYLEDNWSSGISRARGELFFAEGRMVEAEREFHKSLLSIKKHIVDLKDSKRLPAFIATPQYIERMERFQEALLRALAQSLQAQNKLIDAETYYRQALRFSLIRVGRSSSDTGMNLVGLAQCLAAQGRDVEAGRLAEEAVRSFEQSGAAPESVFLAQARRSLATSYVAQGQYAKALHLLSQMEQALQRDPELAAKLLTGDLDWVLAMLRTGDSAGAEKMATSMLAAAEKRQANSLSSAEIRAYLAMTQAARGAEQEALQGFSTALPKLIEQARREDESGATSMQRQKRLAILLESYIGLLETRNRTQGKTEAAAESFRLADIARGSSVQQALAASAARASIRDPQLAELVRKEQDAQQRLASLSALLSQLLTAPPDQQLPLVQSKIRTDIDALKLERERLKKEVAQRFPEYAELISPTPVTLEQARSLLREGEALVAWYFGEQGGWVWALNANGSISFRAVPFKRSEIAAHVQALRKALDPGVASIDAIPSFDIELAFKLYSGLLQAVAPSWQGARSLLVIPHAELGQLPLSVLPTAAFKVGAKASPLFSEYRQVPWLIRQVAITQLPSVTALASLRKVRPASRDRRAFIGFGDPLFSADQAKQAGILTQAETSLATRGGSALHLRNAPQTSGVSAAELSLLPRLPDTSAEIRDIAAVLKADPEQDVYLQKRATVKNVLNTDLSNRRVVMFATHGLVPGELDGLTQPALALTSPAVADPDPDNDGLLTLDKILTLKLNADWVVLSACNTAAGDGKGAEAVSGLGRAFFYAGARALLVSNWPVETVAARKLMTDLFKRQSETPSLSKPEALRQAMLGLVDGAGSVDANGRVNFSYAHPLFWAPFVVVGD